MAVKVYLNLNLAVDKIDGIDVVAVGTGNLKFLVMCPCSIDCDLLFRRPDGVRIGPVKRQSTYTVDDYKVSEFVLDESIFRKAGAIECSIRVTKDGTTLVSYCAINNKYAVPKYTANKLDSDTLVLEVEALQANLDNTNESINIVDKKFDELKIETKYDESTDGYDMTIVLGGNE